MEVISEPLLTGPDEFAGLAQPTVPEPEYGAGTLRRSKRIRRPIQKMNLRI